MEELEQLAGDQALTIRAFKKNERVELAVGRVRQESSLSVRGLARRFDLPVWRVGGWILQAKAKQPRERRCPVSGEVELRQRIQQLCVQD